MSNSKDKKVNNDEFDPTRLDAGGADRSDALEESLPPAFAHIPDQREISQAARQFFAGQLDDSLVAAIVAESEEVAHSTRKILQEHMRIGGNFAHILTRVQNDFVSRLGDTPKSRSTATELVYRFLEQVFRRSRSSVKLYIRCYEKFSTNVGAVQILSLSDMQLLVGNDVGDEIVEMVVDAKKENPELSRREIKKLIADYRDQLAEKDTRLDVVTNQLSDVAGELDDTKSDRDRLTEEARRLQQQIEQEKKNANGTLVELAEAQRMLSVLQNQLANTERELTTRTNELREASEKVQTKEVPVPTLPEHIKNLQEATQNAMDDFKKASEKAEAMRAEVAALEQRRDAEARKIEEQELLEKKIKGLLQKFGDFMQDYHSAQLLVTADGAHKAFTGLFTALADLVGKFHGELQAAARAA
ncbi:hypothetical protein [Paraburkholderia atlantica]|uniref:Chromosome partition protein Smc n=1 Tax=Paraburkholderia atlantica TaxID=2654982 RepID=D5WNY7_PARAM|nr:hypothetical protein [Paraburkholderia atlantica]ADG20610.1 conserved hypothetical protein [Paraburkholderia atlantica]MBB5510794.1 myosin heavy subunit [Paraburkholderia atlantica]